MQVDKSLSIWVKFQVEGFHNWPEAPETVAYLRARHRHMFHFYIEIDVKHDARQIEFHTFRNHWRTFVRYKYGELMHFDSCEFGSMSCEMIAGQLLDKIAEMYPDRAISVSVSEDDECGGTAVNF